MSEITSEILIVGGGAAGLAAAAAASSASQVTIVDDNPLLGGQIWRAELGKLRSPQAIQLVKDVQNGKVRIVNNAQVFGAIGGGRLLAETPEERLELSFQKLIIATGARERFLPFPGWTQPGVYGAGGLQAMVKSGLSVNGERVVVAGTGALLLAVADYLKAKGATVAAIAEQAPAARVRRFALGLWRQPSKFAQGAALRARLAGTPYLTDSWITSISGSSTDQTKTVTLTRKGKQRTIECDLIACGFHLVPNIELAAMIGCEIESGLVKADELQRTSVANVYCAGEPTGIGGVEASLVEGRIAGLAASGRQDEARGHFAERDRTRRFAKALNAAFALRDELKTISTDETIVCRCEDISLGRLKEFSDPREAKLQTRCGMGPCQGRVCGAATEFLFGWKPGTVRPPLFPVKMEHL